MTKGKCLLILSFIFLCSKFIFAQERYHSINERNLSEEAFKTGYYYFNNMDYEASINFFRKSISLFPDNQNANYFLGKAYLFSGYREEAISVWNEFLQRNEGDLFLQDQLNKLYIQPLQEGQNFFSNNNYVFLRYFDTQASPLMIAIDKNNRFYVGDGYRNKVDIYDSNLRIVNSIRSGVKKPTGISFSDQYMFLSSFDNDTVDIYDLKSYEKLFSLGGFGFGQGQLAGPMGTYFYHNKLYVVDQGNNRVQIFQLTPEPYFNAMFGKKGRGAGEFFAPTDIMIENDQIWVLDKGNQRIQIFDMNGNYLDQIVDSQMKNPVRFLKYKGHFLVVDENRGLFLFEKEKRRFKLIKKPSDGIERVTSATIDNNGVLFFAELTNTKVNSYVVNSEKLSSLNLSTIFISKASKPNIVMKLRVQDFQGRDIQGLTSRNFKVLQDGVQMKDVHVTSLRPDEGKIALTVIIRNFNDMQQYQKNIQDYLSQLIKEAPVFNKLSLITYNVKKKLLYDAGGSKARFLDFIKKITFQEPKSLDSFDTILYNTIKSSQFNDSHNAILIIDNANREGNFNHYSLEVISNFARHMGVSLYVVNFGEEGNMTRNFQILTEASHGQFLNYFKSNDLYNILSDIKENAALFYILSYKAPVYQKKASLWAQVVLHLNYRSLLGTDKLGYYLP